MKQAKLPNGQILVFPENTSDKVIKDTVNRISKSKPEVEWTSEHVKSVIRELNASQGQFDLERSQFDLKRSQIDHFGPAIEKQNKTVIESIQKFVSDLVKSSDKNNKSIISEFVPLLKDHIKQVSNVVTNIEIASLNSKANSNNIIKMIDANNKIINELVVSQTKTNTILAKLVDATKASKKIIRDNDGNITGIDIE